MTKKLIINRDRNIAYDELIQSLVDLGYERVPMVMSPGDFSVRGSIVDVFPANHYQGLRFDFFGDDIERLMSFSVSNQCQISQIDETEILPVTSHKTQLTVESVDTQLLASFKPGDFVVHEDYGVGEFIALEHKVFASRAGDYLYIKYKGQDKLYVPMTQIHLVHKYAAADAIPKLNALHDKYWQKLKTKTTNLNFLRF